MSRFRRRPTAKAMEAASTMPVIAYANPSTAPNAMPAARVIKGRGNMTMLAGV